MTSLTSLNETTHNRTKVYTSYSADRSATPGTMFQVRRIESQRPAGVLSTTRIKDLYCRSGDGAAVLSPHFRKRLVRDPHPEVSVLSVGISRRCRPDSNTNSLTHTSFVPSSREIVKSFAAVSVLSGHLCSSCASLI
jgi:hypothetical protein